MSAPLREFLESTPLDALGARQLAVLDASEPVTVALASLAARRVQSAPVVVGAPGAELPGARIPLAAVAGFVSAADVVAAVLDRLPPGTPDAAALATAASAVCNGPLSALVPGGLGAAREAAPEHAFADWRVAHNPKTSLLDAISLFAPSPPPAPAPPPAHRLALSDGGSPPSLRGVVSQSDAVAALARAPAAARAALDAAPLPPCAGPPVVVGAGDTALTAFRGLRDARVSAAPVVDAAGRCVGSISAADYRVMGPGVFGSTLLPVSDFLELRPLLLTSVAHVAAAATDAAPALPDVAALRAQAACGDVGPAPVVTLGDKATLGDAVAALAAGRVHRAWRVDGDGRPVGVVSTTDVLRQALELAGGRRE